MNTRGGGAGMNPRDQILQAGAAAVLELAAKRSGLAGLEQTWGRLTARQRALVPAGFIATLRQTAAKEIRK